MRYFEAVYAKNIFYEKNVYLLIHDLFHDFEIKLDDTKANLELRKLERTYWSMITTSLWQDEIEGQGQIPFRTVTSGLHWENKVVY